MSQSCPELRHSPDGSSVFRPDCVSRLFPNPLSFSRQFSMYSLSGMFQIDDIFLVIWLAACTVPCLSLQCTTADSTVLYACAMCHILLTLLRFQHILLACSLLTLDTDHKSKCTMKVRLGFEIQTSSLFVYSQSMIPSLVVTTWLVLKSGGVNSQNNTSKHDWHCCCWGIFWSCHLSCLDSCCDLSETNCVNSPGCSLVLLDDFSPGGYEWILPTYAHLVQDLCLNCVLW